MNKFRDIVVYIETEIYELLFQMSTIMGCFIA